MERSAVIVGLALSPALDMTYEVDRLERGGIARPRRVTRVAGGKTLNMLRVAHALGAPVHAVAALGGVPGLWVRRLLHDDGVPATVVEIAADTRLCTAVVEDDGATSSTDLYEAAAALGAAEWSAFRAAALAAEPTVAVFSGSLPDGVAPDTAARLAADLRARGARVVVDCAGDALTALAIGADLVKINRSEAEGLLGGPAPDAATAARLVRERFGPAVVVTDGVRGGAAVGAGDEEIPLPPPQHPGRFPAGSGDAFLGGLLAAQIAGERLRDALDAARCAAERNAGVPGQGVLADAVTDAVTSRRSPVRP